MAELTIGAGHWRTMDGVEPDEDLVIDLVGPPLVATDAGYVVVTGYRVDVGDGEPVWVTVKVRADSGGMASGPML